MRIARWTSFRYGQDDHRQDAFFDPPPAHPVLVEVYHAFHKRITSCCDSEVRRVEDLNGNLRHLRAISAFQKVS